MHSIARTMKVHSGLVSCLLIFAPYHSIQSLCMKHRLYHLVGHTAERKTVKTVNRDDDLGT